MVQYSKPTAKTIRLGDNAYITVFMNGESMTLFKSQSESNFNKALEALKSEDWNALYHAFRPVKSFCQGVGNLVIENGVVLFNGKPVHNAIATRIVEMAEAQLDTKPLELFLGKLLKNPSYRAIEELYKFLEHKFMPITDSGNFLAYKGVQDSFYSVYAGYLTLLQGEDKLTNSYGPGSKSILNTVGQTVECPRNEVNDNCKEYCAQGLHAGELGYAIGWGARTVVVEIDPEFVVCVPEDSECKKLRVCKYTVVGEYDKPLEAPVYDSKIVKKVEPKAPAPKKETPKAPEDANVVLEFDTPESDWISSVQFYDDNTLVITKTDGKLIVKPDFSKELAENFKRWVGNGGSAGSFYNRKVKS